LATSTQLIMPAPAPESVLKKRKRAEKWEAESKAQAAAAQTKGADKKAEAFKPLRTTSRRTGSRSSRW